MRAIRESVSSSQFPQFVRKFLNKAFPDGDYEQWIVDALASVNINLIN